MAAFNNVTLTTNEWVNLNTLSGATAGTALNIQNIGNGTVLLQESATQPVNNNGGVLFPPHYDTISKAAVAGGSEIMWGKLIAGTSTVLAFYE